MTDPEVRLFVYEQARKGRIPSPVEIARKFSVTSREVGESLQRLASEQEALVLIPGSSYIWLADPFAALPTDYPVRNEQGHWYGACIWDSLGIAGLVGGQCEIDTACPQSGAPLHISTRDDALVAASGVVHFAVPPSRWWESIGFT